MNTTYPFNQNNSFADFSIKLILAFLTTIVFCTNSLAQQWVSFGNSKEPKSPEVTLVSSTNTEVVFTVEFFGFYSTEAIHDGVVYQKISIPGIENYKQTGYPSLPLLNKPVAYSGKIKPEVSISNTQQILLPNYTVYPAPDTVTSYTPDGFPYIEEVFAMNGHAYNQGGWFPSVVSAALNAGQFRDQKFINVVTHPLQWDAVTKQLKANVLSTVTVNLGTGNELPQKNLGIFSDIGSEMFINYAKQVPQTKKEAAAKSSYVQYYTLTTPADADMIVADYLIIADQQFFDPNNPNDALHRIAAHRANYNGYVVAVLNAQNIMSDAVGFPYERFPQFAGDDEKYKYERRIHACIKSVYDNLQAPHTYDGHLAYVLLVGDALWDTNGQIPSVGIPASHEPYDRWYYGQSCSINSARTPLNAPNDYFYTQLTNIDGCFLLDDYGDIYIGRFCVDDTTQFINMVEKTIKYETEYDISGWKNHSFFFNDDALALPPNAYNYLIDPNGFYNHFLPSVITQPINYTYYDNNMVSVSNQIDSVMSYFNQGKSYISYYGHSTWNRISIGYGTTFITTSYMQDNLINEGKFGFMHLHSCQAGSYDNGEDCFAESLVRYSSNKGFVGIVASSSATGMDQSVPASNYIPTAFQDRLIDQHFRLLSHQQGEYLLLSKIKKQLSLIGQTHEYLTSFNLFGDPALNLRNQGYYISQNSKLDPITLISDTVHVLSGATLTIPDKANVYFEKNGRLIIDEGASVYLSDSVNFYGMEMQNALVVRGTIKTSSSPTKPKISFEAPLGSSCQGLVFENPALNVQFKKLRLIRAGLFANQLNSLTVDSDANNKSIIERSIVASSAKSNTLKNFIFSDASSLSCQVIANNGELCSIKNINFICTAGQPTNQMPCINIFGYQQYDIQDNALNFNNGNALQISNSGNGNLRKIKNNTILFTGNTYTENNGIRIYQSQADIEMNRISNCKYGISTSNNTGKQVRLVGNSAAATDEQTQKIFNNTQYQVYSLDKNSFPTEVRYNYFSNNNTNALIRCGGINIPTGSLKVSCNNWGNGFVATQDLSPFSAYTYLPQWNYNGVCIADNMNTGVVDSNIGLSENNNSAKLLKAEQTLAAPVSLADSVYAAIELAHSLLVEGEGNLRNCKTNSIYIDSLPCNEAEFNIYMEKLIQLLYLEEQNKDLDKTNFTQDYSLSIQPNPVSTILQLRINKALDNDAIVSLIEPRGGTVLNIKIEKGENEAHLDISTLSNGVYTVVLMQSNKFILSKKVIVLKQ